MGYHIDSLSPIPNRNRLDGPPHPHRTRTHALQVNMSSVPPKARLGAAGMDRDKVRTKLLDINGQDKLLTIYPIRPLVSNGAFLKPRYRQVKWITLENTDIIFPARDGVVPTTPEGVLTVLENLPSGFTRDFSYGLGIAHSHRFIVDVVEKLSTCTEIVITRDQHTQCIPDQKLFYISTKDFEQARRALTNIDRLAQTAARSVKTAVAHNILAESLGLPKMQPNVGRHPYRKLFTAFAQGKEELKKEDQNAVMDVLSCHAAKIAEDQPEKLAKLRGDIDLVSLQILIDKYERMLSAKIPEDRWQDFFNENPFVLNMAFGYPVIKVRDQASEGGRKLSGDGEKITDFLVKNSLTNNIAIFEIKTPQTDILNKKPFRDGVYTPLSDLSGSMNQTLDQKYQLQKQIAQIKDNTRIYDIESYAVHCCLVIGQTPDSADQKKSFELFRRNSKDVEIVTFNELLEKLKQLSDFLRIADEGLKT